MKNTQKNNTELLQNEERFRLLFDAVEDSVIMFEILPDGSRGKIQDVNGATCKRLGYSRDELLEMTVMDIDASESEACKTTPLERYSNGTAIFEALHQAKDGRVIPTEVNASKFEYNGRNMVMAICRDITERKQKELRKEKDLSQLRNELEIKNADLMEINRHFREQTAELNSAKAKALQHKANIRALIESSSQSIFMIRPDGTLIYVNRKLAEILKKNQEELIGKNVYDYINPDLAFFRKQKLQEAIISRQIVRFRDFRDGKPIFHTIYPIVENGEVNRIAIYAEDMSEVSRRETELKHYHHTYSVLYDILSQSHLLTSLDEMLQSIHQIMLKELKAENFFVALIDEESRELRFKYCVDSTITSCPTIADIYNPENNRLSLLPIRENRIIYLSRVDMLDMINRKEIEVVGVIPEVWLGVPMKIKGQPIGVLVIQDYELPRKYTREDIHLFEACSDQLAIAIERKKHDQAMSESEEQFRALFEDNHTVMLIISPDSGMILNANKAAEIFYGLSKEELAQKHIYDLNTLSPEEINAAMNRAKKLNQKSFIFRHKLGSGEVRDVEVFSGPIEFKGKTRLISIIHDITERIRSEHELSAAKEAAVSANRAKDEFLANISHEIRTPLNGVMGMLQLLEHSEMEQKHKKSIDIALHSSRNLLKVLDDILDISKIEMGTLTLIKETFNLKDLTTECMNLFTIQAMKKNLELTSSIIPEICGDYSGDQVRIRQILFNLLGNAIKFTDSGAVTLSIGGKRDEAAKNHELNFTVHDTGVGIPEEKLGIIFNSFTQVDGSLSRRFAGAGLGLSIVKRLINLMDGKISVKSKLGHGTTVTVTLPLQKTETTGEKQKPVKVSSKISPMKIMLVEDERVNRMMARRILEKMGHTIVCASNGKECLDLLATEPVDIILMDIQMPVMDGIEATRIIRNSNKFLQNQNIPILALSAHANDKNRSMAEAAGMDGYISKPFEWDMLEQALARASHALAC